MNIIKIIAESTISFSMRQDLINLCELFGALKAEENLAIAEMHRSKAGINERQYAQRLSEPASEAKRNDILVVQYAWRALFANSVMRAHEARLGLVKLAESIKATMEKLGPQSEPTTVRALIALTNMLSDTEYKDAASILAELMNVNHLDCRRIFEAVQTIFRCKKTRTGVFADRNFSAQVLQSQSFEWWQVELNQAVQPAVLARAEMEERWNEFISAKSKVNVPQFTKRIEQAWAHGDNGKVEQIRQERKNAEARLFVAATRYQDGMKQVAEADATLQAAFDKAAAFIDENDLSVKSVKAMTHALGIWHWLGELRIYILPKYNSHNVPALLEDLAFDADSYLNS